VLGEGGGGCRPTGAAAPLDPVLGHGQAQPRHVEHLPGLDPDHHRVGQVRAAADAPVGDVLNHLVGLGDLRQVGTGGTGLLARPTPLTPLGGTPLGPRGLAQPIRGGRLGRVGGVLAEPTFQLGDSGLERGDQTGLLGLGRNQSGVGRPQLRDDRGLDCDGGFQIGIEGSDRGLQDNERSSPLALGPAWTATPAAVPPSNQSRRGTRP